MKRRSWVTNRLSLKPLVTFLGIFVLLYSTCSFAAKPVVSNRDIDRRVLFEIAFENLGFYMTAVEANLRLDPNEKKAFNEIALLANERKRAILYNKAHFKLGFSGNNNDFIIPGEGIRSAVTGEDPLSEVLVNLNIIQDPKINLDLLDAVQILIHEFSHKTPHSKKGYADTMAAKVSAALRNSAVKYEVEPGYSIFVLGLTSPFINIYNFLRTKGTDDSKLLTEVYLYTLLYQGAEITMLEYRGTKIRQRSEISGYLTNPIGFSNIPQGPSNPLLPLSLTSVQNIAKEQVGERFPLIKLSLVTHQELVEYNGATVSTPKVVANDLVRQMSAITIYYEIVIYTDRNGIKKISKREYKQQYAPESAKITQFENKDGMLQGSGELVLESTELEYITKNNPQISVLLKFKDSQTAVPAEITNTKDKIEFKFAAKADPAVGIVMIDQIDMKFAQGGQWRTLAIPTVEAKKLSFNKKQISDFNLMAWRVQDHRGETYLHVAPESSPLIITEPGNNNASYELGFLFKSATPIRELVLSTRMGDQVYKDDGLVKYSRIMEHTLRIPADEFIQERSGPYIKVYLNMATTLTPKIVVNAEGDRPEKVAMSPEYRITISKLRAINENLQVVEIDDALSSVILNSSRLINKLEPRPNKCRDRF